MKRVVARSADQVDQWAAEMKQDLERLQADADPNKGRPGLTIQWEKYSPPRSRKQQKRLHAMIRDVALFTGNTDVKGDLKKTDVWPKEEVTHTKFHADGSQTRHITMDPKSEADLSREEESLIIDLMFMIGEKLGPTFYWSDPADKS